MLFQSIGLSNFVQAHSHTENDNKETPVDSLWNVKTDATEKMSK